MTPEEQFTLLIRLDERTKSIDEKITQVLTHAENGGWVRCHTREARITDLEISERDRRDGMKWFKRITISSLVGLTLAQGWKIFFA